MRRFLVILPAAALLGALAFAFRPEPPPVVYRGKSADAWVRDLADADYVVRDQARTTLKEMGRQATNAVSRALRTHDSALHETAFRLSQRLGFGRVAPPVAHLHREKAAAFVADMGPHQPAAVPALIELLTDRHAPVVQEAEGALRRIGAPAVDAVIAALESGDKATRAAAARVLRDFTPPPLRAVEPLRRSLNDSAANVRTEAAVSLGRIAPPTAKTTAALGALLGDGAPHVRAAAAQALGRQGPSAAPLVAALRRRLIDEDAAVRLRAAEALWHITQDASLALPALCACLGDDDLRWQAALVAGEIGPEAAPAVPALIEALKHEQVHRPARFAASTSVALGKIGKAAVPSLIEVLSDTRPHARLNAAAALGQIGPDARAAASALVSVLSEADGDLRLIVTLSLVSIGADDPRMAPALIEMAGSGEEHMRAAATEALARIAPQTLGDL